MEYITTCETTFNGEKTFKNIDELIDCKQVWKTLFYIAMETFSIYKNNVFHVH